MAPVKSDSDDEIWGLLAGSVEDEATAESATARAPSAIGAAGAGGRQAEEEVEERSVVGGEASSAPATGSSAPAQPPETASPSPAAPAAPASPLKPGFRKGAALLGRGGARIPADILEDPELNAAIAETLPTSWNFEVHRTIWRLRRVGARHVGLQMPEGLQEWALALSDIFQRFAPSVQATTIMGDVTFGACCIDDLGARAVGVDFLIHYGHSCIVPTDQTTVTTLYVLVEVEIDVEHLVETVRANFPPERRVSFMGTVQFTPGTQRAAEELRREYFIDEKASGKVPQVKPLSVGETLGCTSPIVDANEVDAVVFVCDGRFHLESAMIQNPGVKGGFFRYDPFYKTLTRESFGHAEMHRQRRDAIEAAKGARLVGLILSTLGRQGSSGVLEGVEVLLEKRGVQHLTVLLSDVSPDRLNRFEGVDAWVQVACPRLSIDWGDAYSTPLLTPYEAHIAWGDTEYKDIYPMDYYSNRGGPWSNYGAHNGHGGSLDKKFRHLGRKRLVGYEEDEFAL